MEEEERTPPERIRTTGLQEAQLADLIRMEQAGAQLHYEAGLDSSLMTPRGEREIGALPRKHNVFVAEADHQPAGYLAWRDEQPGVAIVEALVVDPDFQRFGIGTRLLREMSEDARKHGINFAIVPCWKQATWAHAFLAVLGFKQIEGKAPEPVSRWLELQKGKTGDDPPAGQLYFWRQTEGLGVKELPGVPPPQYE